MFSSISSEKTVEGVPSDDPGCSGEKLTSWMLHSHTPYPHPHPQGIAMHNYMSWFDRHRTCVIVIITTCTQAQKEKAKLLSHSYPSHTFQYTTVSRHQHVDKLYRWQRNKR